MSDSTDTLFQQAFSDHESGRHSEAREKYEQILADNPDHADTLHMLGVLFYQKGDNAYLEDHSSARRLRLWRG